jgi:hypothetical protein
MHFQMPKSVKIIFRSSSITNAFFNGIIPSIEPTKEQIIKVLEILHINNDNITCCYCGDKATEWDHFRPLIINKKPTGYISEIHNLVPSCSKCNQSKGNKEWLKWIESDAKLSPRTRSIKNLTDKIKYLKKFEKWEQPIIIDNFELIVGKELWNKHNKNLIEIHQKMKEYQQIADEIKRKLETSIKAQKSY